MNRIRILLGLILLASVGHSLFAQPLPSLRFKLMSIDFDTILEEKGPVERRFIVYNDGTSALRLIEVQPGCGCTTSDWTRTPIAPGDSGYVTAVYDPTSRPGAFHKTIGIPSNDPKQLQAYLAITGYVVGRKLTIEEIFPVAQGGLRFKDTHSAFGDVFVGQIVSDTMPVYNGDSVTVSLKKHKHTQEWCSLSLIPAKLKPGEEGKMIIKYDASRRNDWGLVYDDVRFNTGGKTEQEGNITVSLNILQDYRSMSKEELASAPQAIMDNSEFRFGSLRRGQPVEHEFVISNTGKSPLQIKKVSSSCDCISWTSSATEIAPGGTTRISVRMDTTTLIGRQHKMVTIVTNAPSSQVLRISLLGNVG